MNRRSLIGLPIIAALGLALVPAQGIAQPAKDIVGTWVLVSASNYGASPKGTLMFDANGHFAAMLMRSNLPKYASNVRVKGTPEEYKATVEGSLAYYGTYTINGTEMTLHIESSTFANANGADQKRVNLSVSGDELKYVTPAPSSGGPADPLVWKRVK